MKTIYLAGPFRGRHAYDVRRNVVLAERVLYGLANDGWARGCPVAVLCPHTMSAHLDGTCDDAYWLASTMELMRRCDAVLMFGGWKQSAGSMAEKAEAERLGLPVFTYFEDVLEWAAEEVRHD